MLSELQMLLPGIIFLVAGFLAFFEPQHMIEGYIVASVPDRLHGAEIVFPKVTVGGTENPFPKVL